MSRTVFIGIDDTDIIGSPGTGKVARGLGQRLADLGLAVSLGVSRHQLLVDPRVKYTSHNSAKGIALRTDKPVIELYQPCISYVKSCFQPGSDPGLCICGEEQVTKEIIRFGQRAKTTVLNKEEARALAEDAGIFLKELGGDGGGVIGALAGVGLRAGANDGRLVDIRGVRDIRGIVSVRDVKQRTDIESVQDVQGNVVPDVDMIDSLDWIRPSLINGKAVLRVKLAEREGKTMWLPAEKKFSVSSKKEA